MGIYRHARGTAIPAFDDPAQVFRYKFSSAHVEHRPYDSPHHIAQKTIGCNGKDQSSAFGTFPPSVFYVAHERFHIRIHFRKTLEILVLFQDPAGQVHSYRVDFVQ